MGFVPRPLPLLASALLGAALLSVALPAAPASASTLGSARGSFVAIAPTRVVDTRAATPGHPKGVLGAGAHLTAQIGGHGGVPVAGVSAVVVTISTVAPSDSGSVTAWAAATTQPATTNVSFQVGQPAADLAVVPVSAGGAIELSNNSAGTVHLVVDVSGYYRDGAVSARGAFSPLAAQRVFSTLDGRDRLESDSDAEVQIAGVGGVPATGVSAVVVTLTAVAPEQTGALVAWQFGQPQPRVTNLQWQAGQPASSNLAVVQLSPTGKIAVHNASAGQTDLVVDVAGYYVGGVATMAATFEVLTPSRVLDTRHGTAGNPMGSVPAGHPVSVQVSGHGGVPRTGVAAVIVTITAVAPLSAGTVTAWDGRGPAPIGPNLQVSAGQQTSTAAVVPMSATGSVALYNRSSGSMHLVLDVAGYYLKSDLAVPSTSISHYVRDIAGAFADPGPLGEGCVDAAAGSAFVLLDIGAQLNDGTGVALSAVDTQVTYADLRIVIDKYLASFALCRGAKSATIAVGTNNDGDFTEFTAADRGKAWATRLVNRLAVHPGMTVVGADDIESNFASTEAQAEAWELAYLDAATGILVFNGAATGCPSSYDTTGQTCSYGWTQAQYYRLAYALSPGRIRALPQVYAVEQAIQWADIDATGGRRISFAGSLTEHASGCDDDCVMSPDQGWAALYHALASIGVRVDAVATDLRIDG